MLARPLLMTTIKPATRPGPREAAKQSGRFHVAVSMWEGHFVFCSGGNKRVWHKQQLPPLGLRRPAIETDILKPSHPAVDESMRRGCCEYLKSL